MFPATTLGAQVVLALATHATIAIPLPATIEPCSVNQVAQGRYRLVMQATGSGFSVEFVEASPITFDTPRRRGAATVCDKAMGSVEEHYAPGATSILKQLGYDVYLAAQGIWSVSGRQQLDYPVRDLGNLAYIAGRETWIFTFEGELGDKAWAVATKYHEGSDLLTDDGAVLVADQVVIAVLQGYVAGSDPMSLVDALVTQLMRSLQGRATRLVDPAVRGLALQDPLRAHVVAIVNDVVADVINAFPGEQIVRLESAELDGCVHALDLSWTMRGGRSRAVLTIRCGEEEEEEEEAPEKPEPPPPPRVVPPVVTLVTPTLKPGEAGEVSVSATTGTAPSAPIIIADATATGIAAVAPTGSPEPNAALVGGSATFAFAAARPRRDAPFPVRVQIRTDNASGRLAEVRSGSIIVENVPPSITAINPDAVSAEPGETLTLDGALVDLVDDNADRVRFDEVTSSTLTLAHPDGLRTQPLFDRAENPVRISHDGGAGRYQFRFSRSGKVEDPHPHGTWAATVTMADDNGARGTSTIALTVEDVAPEVLSVVVNPGSVHRGQGALIQVEVRVRDANEAADITGVTIDARDAGGGIYALGQGLVEIGRGPDWIDLRLAQPFRQTDVPGPHPIPVTVEDERQRGTGSGSLFVGNTAPRILGYGYITGIDPATERSAEDGFVRVKGVCPNEPFRAGAIAADDEADPLSLTATIVETGAQGTFRNTGGRIWMVDMHAPGAPGVYTIRIDVHEVPPDKSSSVTMPLEVVPCDPARQERRIALAQPVTPADVAVAPRDPGSQALAGSFAGAVVGGMTGGQTPGASGPSVQGLHDALRAVLAGLGEPGTADVETYLIATGGSTGPVVQFFGLHSGNAPVAMPTTLMVFEPVQIDRATQQRINELVTRLLEVGAMPTVLNAYCLELMRKPPEAGTVLRVAAAPEQARLGSLGGLFDASDRLAAAGAFRPDSDPGDYLHAVRQWAIWVDRERLDLRSYEREFLRVTRDNVTSAGETWNNEVEQVVRGLVPNRWNDIQRLLAELRGSDR